MDVDVHYQDHSLYGVETYTTTKLDYARDNCIINLRG